MTTTRRTFLSAALGAAGLHALDARPVRGARRAAQSVPEGIDPWIEVDREALRANARAIAGLSGGRPTLAVIKNNGYGLGTVEVAEALEGVASIAGFAVVKVSAALELRHAGIRKPVLHMGATTVAQAEEMVREGVRLALFDPADPARLERLAQVAGGPVPAHVYIDTGMRRLGVAAHRALPWLRELVGGPVSIEGTFMGFTEEEFDREQLARFQELASGAQGEGIDLGVLHAASSHGLFQRPEAFLDMVRPGLALYGAYPSGADTSAAHLTPAFRLRARVARVERLREGDTVSYGRAWRAERPTWTATLPVGHADGYPRRAVDGCEVLIGDRLYPVVGAVSASHTIVVLGDEPSAAVGDVATLVGPDDPAVHPNEVARRTGASVYDVLMHLGQKLPRVVM
jgi:alanine racemase